MRKFGGFIIATCLALSTAGCVAYTQDEFGWEVETYESLITIEHGILHLRLLQQREGWNQPLTPRQILIVLNATITAYEERFGPLAEEDLDVVRSVTILIVDDHSSLWEAICDDPPGDWRSIDGCTLTLGWLFDIVGYDEPPAPDTGLRPTQIAIINHVYQRGTGDLGIYAHELMHTLLYVGPTRVDDADHDHRVPGAWENGAVGRAVEISRARL